jgi:hypothetical protein
MNKQFFFVLFSLHCFLLFPQSRKKQIQNLNRRLDSLQNVLLQERQDYKMQNLLIKYRIDSLKLSLSNYKEELSLFQSDINNNKNEITSLKKLLQQKDDSLKFFRISSDSILLIDKPVFALNDETIISIVENRMKEGCPTEDVYGNTGPNICRKEVVNIEYFELEKNIYLFASVGFSFEGGHCASGSNGFILMRYLNGQWTLIDFLELNVNACSWGKSLSNGTRIILGKKSVAFQFYSGGILQGNIYSATHIIGTNKEKIHIFLDEASGADEYKNDETKTVSWSYQYSIIPTNSEWKNIKREKFEFDKPVGTNFLKYNKESGKFE